MMQPVAVLDPVHWSEALHSFVHGKMSKTMRPADLLSASSASGIHLSEDEVAQILSQPRHRSAISPEGGVDHALAVFYSVLAWLETGGLHRLAKMRTGRRVALGREAQFLRFLDASGRVVLDDVSE